mgnify:FL=1
MTGPAYVTNETTDEMITIVESLRDVITKTITNKELTSNVATLTTSTSHGLLAGDSVTVTGVGSSSFDGTWTISSVPSSTTFSFSSTASNVPSGSASGTVTFGPDILSIDTRDHEVALNGDVVGYRNMIDVLAEWTLLTPGDNQFSFYDEGNANSTASLAVYYRSAWLG